MRSHMQINDQGLVSKEQKVRKSYKCNANVWMEFHKSIKINYLIAF